VVASSANEEISPRASHGAPRPLDQLLYVTKRLAKIENLLCKRLIRMSVFGPVWPMPLRAASQAPFLKAMRRAVGKELRLAWECCEHALRKSSIQGKRACGRNQE
jgi:hypothetical protein